MSVMRLVLSGLWAALVLSPAAAYASGCFPLAQTLPGVQFASLAPAPMPAGATVRITFLGHASFLLETRGGISAITDYNAINVAPFSPTIVTMNNSHETHWTSYIEPGIKHALQGWSTGGGVAEHDLTVGDLRVRNVATSVWGRVGDQVNSNSIFIFEMEDLCVAHLGHLHHRLEDYHLGELGVIDILLVPVDGMWTMPQAAAVDVVEQVRPSVVIPMHYFATSIVENFVAQMPEDWSVVFSESRDVSFSRQNLPYKQVLVLPGN